MDSNLINRVSQIIEIEDDIIDLDGAEKTPEELIYEWDAKIRKKLSMFAVADNENVLGDLMKEYLQSLQEMARSFDDNETLKNKVFCHISFLYSYYVELQCCTPDNYLTNMEDILTLYCNLELEVIRPLKKKDLSKHKYKKRILSVSRQVIHVLTVYLFERHDHILHVLIKMNTNNISESCSEVLNILYTHFLTKVPAFNLCDESFCRNYIVFQKWKEIRKVEDWEGMDKIMYKMFKRTPESIKNNETLRQILMPACQSTVDIVLNLFRSFRDISSAYFKHVIAKKNVELDDLDFNIDLGEDEPTIPVDDENEEEVKFLKAYYEVERNMSNLATQNHNSNMAEIDIFRKCKEEFDDDDDVQFIGITILPKQQVQDILIEDDESSRGLTNTNKRLEVEEARIPIPASPSLLNSAKEKNPDLENLNGITRICVGSPRTVTETSNSCPTVEVQPTIELSNPPLSSQQEMTSCEVPVETNQPKVSLVSNNTPVPSPSSPTKISDSVSDIDSLKRTIEMKSVEVQADTIKDYLYNDYGLTTPPFDVPADEQISRPVEPRLYTNIGQNLKDDLTLERDVCEKNAVVTRTVEVQVDPPPSRKECPYNDYGLTPPNEVQLDDHTSRSQETCLYTDIGQNHKDLSDNEKIVKETYISDSEQIDAHNSEVPQVDDVAQERTEIEIERPDDVIDNPEILPNAKKKFDYESCPVDGVNVTIEHDSEFEDFENQLDISEMTNIDTEYDTEEIDVESCPDPDKDSPLVPDEAGAEVQNHNDTHNFEIRVNPELQIPKDAFSTFKTSDQIDTGQKVILNTAPNIEAIASIDNCSETKDTVPETFNGNTVLKPLLSSNRTNGQAKDVGATPTKIMYTSSQKIKSTTLDDFSRFESAMHVQWNKMKENHDFEEILSGPVSKIMPTKHNNLLAPSDKLDIFNTISQEANTKAVTNTNSRSNSPTEMTSPAYEAIDDFRNYFSDSVNGRVPPTHDVRVPQSILKKNNSTRKKNYRIMFHESTCDNSEERRLRSDGVLVPKRVRRDRKLNMEPRVVVERLSFIENKMKKVLNNPPTLRVDYDKTTTHINEKDVVRCISPPRFSWIVNLSPSRHNPGSLTVKNREHLEKKPKKRKFEPQNNSIDEPAIRKRAFRTTKKKSLATKGVGRVRKRQNSGSSENNFVSKSDSEFDKLLNSGAYSNKPFRLDLTS